MYTTHCICMTINMSITQVYDLTILSNFFSLGFFFSWVDTDMHLVNFVSQIVI